MRADLDDAGAVEDHDEVGHPHRAAAVRHEGRDAAANDDVRGGGLLPECQVAGNMAAWRRRSICRMT
jgi:hypothetical protein